MLIYPPARSQAVARIWMIVYLLNVAVRSELARGKGLHPLSVAVRSELARVKGQEAPHPWYGVKWQGAGLQSMYTGQVASTEEDT